MSGESFVNVSQADLDALFSSILDDELMKEQPRHPSPHRSVNKGPTINRVALNSHATSRESKPSTSQRARGGSATSKRAASSERMHVEQDERFGAARGDNRKAQSSKRPTENGTPANSPSRVASTSSNGRPRTSTSSSKQQVQTTFANAPWIRQPSRPTAVPTSNSSRKRPAEEERPLDLAPARDSSPEPCVEVIEVSSPPPPKRKSGLGFDWKPKPRMINCKTYDLTITGLKSVIVGNDWADGFLPMIVLCKLDAPNAFLVLNEEEWKGFKLYFETIDDYYKGNLTPTSDPKIGRYRLKFQILHNKPTLVIWGEDVKFLMMAPVFNRLKACTYVIELALHQVCKQGEMLRDICTGRCDLTDRSPEKCRLYAEVLRCESLYSEE